MLAHTVVTTSITIFYDYVLIAFATFFNLKFVIVSNDYSTTICKPRI